jgi:hypothetical protein
MGCTSGDYERELEAPLCHCLTPRGWLFSALVIKKSMTHTSLDEFYFTTAEKKLLENCRFSVPNFMND